MVVKLKYEVGENGNTQAKKKFLKMVLNYSTWINKLMDLVQKISIFKEYH